MTTAANQPTHRTRLEELAALLAEGQPLPALNVDEIDACCTEYDLADRALETATARVTLCKQTLIALVKEHGHVPAGAEESRRVLGRRSIATITTAKTTTVREDGVTDLEEYLGAHGLDALFDQLFVTNTKHSLKKSAHDVLRATQLRKPEADKVEALFGSCIDVKPKAPSLKIESVVPEKPARTPRGRKVAA